jgi:hypothetical protein
MVSSLRDADWLAKLAFYVLSIFVEQLVYFRIYNKPAIQSILMLIIISLVIILCRVEFLEWGDFCHDRILVGAAFFKSW